MSPPSGPPRRRVVVALSAAILLGLGLVLFGLAVSATQTDWGRERIRSFLVARMASIVHGKLYVGRLSGNLLTHIEIDSLEVRDPEGRLFASTGRVSVRFDPRDLVDERILLQHVEVDHPIVRIFKYRSTGWNYKEIFPSSGPKRRSITHVRGFGDYIVAQDVQIRNGWIDYAEPWDADDSLRGAKRDSVIAAQLAKPDSNIRRWPNGEGLMRSFRWHRTDLKARYLRLANPDTAGVYVNVDDLSTDESDPLFKFRHVRGGVRLLGDSLFLELPHFELPGSGGHANGKLVFGPGTPARVNLHVVADTASLSDIAWVYPTLPTTGGGSATVDIKSEKDTHFINFALTKVDVTTVHSRFRGALTFGTGGPYLAVKNLAVKVTPLDFKFIEQLSGQPFPVPYAGQFTGTINARGGPLNKFLADSINLAFADAHVPGATSRFVGSGELDIHDPQITRFHNFHLQLGRLDLRTLQFLYPLFPHLNGIVVGTATLDSLWNDIRFRDGVLTQIDGDGEPNHATGSGHVSFIDTTVTYDIAAEFAPLSFETLLKSYPGAWFRGTFAGPMRMKGTMDDLTLSANVTSDAGSVNVNGHFNLVGPRFVQRGTVTFTDADLKPMLGRPALPSTDLTLTATGETSFDSLADLTGPLTVDVKRSVVDSIQLDTAHALLHFADGAVRIDSARMRTALATVDAEGALGLVTGHHDSLGFTATFDSLGAFRRYLSGDSVSGAGQVTGMLGGWLDSLSARGRADVSEMHFAHNRVHDVQATFNVDGMPHRASGTVAIALDTVRLFGLALQRVTGEARLAKGKESRATVHVESQNGPTADAGLAIFLHGDTTEVEVDSLALRTPGNDWHLDQAARVWLDRSGVTLDSVMARGAVAGWVTAKARIPYTAPVAIHIAADSIPLADLGALGQLPDETGGIAGFTLDVASTRARPTMQMTGLLRDLRFGDVGIDAVRMEGGYGDKYLDLHTDFVQRGDTALHVHAVLPIDLALENVKQRILDDPLTGNLHSDSAKLETILAVFPTVRNPTGSFFANVDLAGTWRHPVFTGEIRVVDGNVGMSDLGVRWVGVNADFKLTGDSLALGRVVIGTDEGDRRGTATLGGWVTFADIENPHFNLWLRADHLHALDRPRLANLTVSTKSAADRPDTLRLIGSELASVLTGKVLVDHGSIFLPDFNRKQVVNLDDPELYNLVDTSLFVNRRLLPNGPPKLVGGLALNNVSVDLGADTWLKSTEANINLSGSVDVTTARLPRDTTKALAFTGAVSATRGSYLLNLGLVQRTFTVQQPGTITFAGEPEFNPTLDISAVNVVHPSGQTQAVRPELRIQVHLGGTLDHLTLALSSPDSLPQTDLISYLVSGVPSYELNQSSSGALATSIVLPTIGSAVGSRLTGGLFDTFEVQTFGQGYNATSGRSDFGSAFSSARIGAGKQVGPGTFISADYGFCSTEANPGYQLGVRIDQRLTRQLSLSAASSPGTTYAYCTGSNVFSGFIPTPRQYGFDLFRTWSF